MSSMLQKHRQRVILSLIFAILLLLPIVLQRGLYYVGGDDTRLYYLFPDKYLKNLALNIISDNTLGGANTGYYPASQFAPILYVILFLKTTLPFVNTQNLMYGLNYGLSFLAFYFLVDLLINVKTRYSFYIKTISSLFYTLSPFLIGTLYKHQLHSLYLVALIPTLFYLFIKALRDNKVVYSILFTFLFSIFSVPLNTIPYTIPILITSVPILISLLFQYKKRFIIHLAVIFSIGLLLNMHWLYHLVNSQVFVRGLSSTFGYYASGDFVSQNVRGILGTSTLFSPLSVVLTTMDRVSLMSTPSSYLVNSVFLITILVAGFCIRKKPNKELTVLYALLILCFLISWFMFSPNLGNWGPHLFLNFVTNVPYMTMFRNMYDKFALPLAFYFALCLAVSLSIVADNFGKKLNSTTLFLVFLTLIVLYNGQPLYSQKILSEGTIATVTGEFNQDFNDLVKYFNEIDNASRILWIPMTAPNYVSVEDAHFPDHYYSGLSPMRILAGRGDYAGRFSFIFPGQNVGDMYLQLLKDKKYDELGYALQNANARYIIVDNSNYPLGMRGFLFDADNKYIDMQAEDYRSVLLGSKIRDFGSRYSLYEINEKYLSDRIFLTDDLSSFPTSYNNVSYKKISSYEYIIEISDFTKKEYLVFVDPYYDQWKLSAYDNSSNKYIPINNRALAYGWTNAWKLGFERTDNADQIDKNTPLKLSLIFEPSRINIFLYPFTIIAYGLTGLYLLFNLSLYLKRLWRN